MAKTPNIDLREDYQRNYIINGNFDFWQRGTSLLIDGQVLFLADRFLASNSSSGSLTIDRSTDVPDANSTYSMQATVTSTGTLTTNQADLLGYRMEGYDLQQLAGKTFVLSFKVKSSVAGVYSIAFRNEANDRSYITEYTINQVNVWEEKTIVIKHDLTGTWDYTNGVGLRISWMLDSGPDIETSTLDQWQNGLFISSSNQTNFMNNSGATFKLSQVQVAEGTEVLPFRRAGKTISEELQMCQRYYEKTYEMDIAPGTPSNFRGAEEHRNCTGNGLSASHNYVFTTTKRTLPTMTYYVASSGDATGLPLNLGNSTLTVNNPTNERGGYHDITEGATTGGQSVWHWTADAEL